MGGKPAKTILSSAVASLCDATYGPQCPFKRMLGAKTRWEGVRCRWGAAETSESAERNERLAGLPRL
jgi:hypothetical protein